MSLRLAAKMLLLALLVVYAAQTSSPLRLNTDSIKYLSMADSAARGNGFTYRGSVPNAPSGYPAIVMLMGRAGVDTAPWIIGLQVLFLVGFIACADVLLREALGMTPEEAGWILVIVLGSYFTLKHTLLPLADNAYDFFSTASLVLLTRSRAAVDGRRWALLLTAGLVAGVAVCMRAIGMALLPAILWQAIVLIRARPDRQAISRSLLVTASIIGMVLAVVAALAGRVYLREGFWVYSTTGPLQAMGEGMWQAMIEAGSILTNLPSQGPAMDYAVAPFGAAAIFFLLYDLWQRRRALEGLDVYLLGFVGILLFWASNGDPRLWVPVFPIVLARLWIRVRPSVGRLPIRMAAITAAVVYATLGVVGIASVTRTSFSGRAFPDHYGIGPYPDSYRAALGFEPPTNPARVDPEIVSLLRRHDPKHAAGRALP